MQFARISSLVLAIGGAFWALLLLGATFKMLQFSAGGLVWLVLWSPGFVAWYAYVRRVFGHYLFRRARITWQVSLAANVWSLLLMAGRPSIALLWNILAIVLSIVCLRKERDLREPDPQKPTHVTADELKNLLNEHRKNVR